MSISKSIVSILVISIFALAIPTTASATWFISSSGILSNISNSILGEQTEVEIEVKENEAAKQTQEQTRERAKEMVEQQREEAKQKAEMIRETAKQKMEITREAKKQLLEKKLQSTEFELESDDSTNLRIREIIKNQDGTIAEVADRELEGEDKVEITRQDGTVVTVSARTANRLQIMRDGIKAGTTMPISVSDQNEIILTKKDGTTRVLTVLPDEAIGHLKDRGLLTDVPVDAPQPEITEEAGEPVYKIEGEKQEKIMGLFRINLKRQVNVSAETGEVVSTQESLMTKILDIFSF